MATLREANTYHIRETQSAREKVYACPQSQLREFATTSQLSYNFVVFYTLCSS